MKWVNHIAIAGPVTAVWRPELVPLAVLGSNGPRTPPVCRMCCAVLCDVLTVQGVPLG